MKSNEFFNKVADHLTNLLLDLDKEVLISHHPNLLNLYTLESIVVDEKGHLVLRTWSK